MIQRFQRVYGKLGPQSTIGGFVTIKQTPYSRMDQRHGAHQTRLFGKVDVVTGTKVSYVATGVTTPVTFIVVFKAIFRNGSRRGCGRYRVGRRGAGHELKLVQRDGVSATSLTDGG